MAASQHDGAFASSSSAAQVLPQLDPVSGVGDSIRGNSRGAGTSVRPGTSGWASSTLRSSTAQLANRPDTTRMQGGSTDEAQPSWQDASTAREGLPGVRPATSRTRLNSRDEKTRQESDKPKALSAREGPAVRPSTGVVQHTYGSAIRPSTSMLQQKRVDEAAAQPFQWQPILSSREGTQTYLELAASSGQVRPATTTTQRIARINMGIVDGHTRQKVLQQLRSHLARDLMHSDDSSPTRAVAEQADQFPLLAGKPTPWSDPTVLELKQAVRQSSPRRWRTANASVGVAANLALESRPFSRSIDGLLFTPR